MQRKKRSKKTLVILINTVALTISKVGATFTKLIVNITIRLALVNVKDIRK